MVDFDLVPKDADLKGRAAIVIPAYNEENTVAGIVAIAAESEIGNVFVVDDGSQDATKELALKAGANVIAIKENVGKGGAVHLAAELLQTDVIILLDADLVGLTAEHIKDLAKPVLNGSVDMTRGNFSGGRLQTTAAQKITPQLNGQRAIIRKKLLELPDFSNSRYGIEVAITKGATKQKWRTKNIDFRNVSQVMKEEKRGILRGLKTRLCMYRDIVAALFKS